MILVGFMGSGKTTIGKNIAEELNKAFVDLDGFIVNEYQMSIPEIFNEYGENGFREREFEALNKVIKSDAIISTGGGIVTYQKSYNLLMNTESNIIYLDTPFEVAYNRIKNDRNRPLTNFNKSDLDDIYKKRRPLYEELTDYTINGCDSVNEIIHNILMHKK
ncbi:shikimate kinase [Phocicoccus pinnipedialis]|uniref:Shikimate kinase n=1 Tax=Phocicoccus pinnipedialis TaxID=110845 RepID=A0A6V7RDS2_9BACL|nr:shikimate kinase [Jeotgalicoccus pinnipedialis]MBP1939307.1 shikimate kinase [Jeotgalicoccus pinnipedialis]CAD2075945.1 Shikimate kinase [Jeotgalicoccus pinnipedialis]